MTDFLKSGTKRLNVNGEMTMDDRKLQRWIEQRIANGAVTLPEWTWATPKPYLRFSGEDRIRGWQIVKIAERLGHIPPARQCTICGTTAGKIERHNEDYARPLLAKPICRSCHRKLHLRFKYPDQWRRHVARHGDGSKWFEHLEM